MGGRYGAADAENEIADAQAAMDPTRSECVRPTVLDHLHRQMRADTWRKKYMELHGIITACLAYASPTVKEQAKKQLHEEHELYEDYITKNKDKHDAGIDWFTIEESEFMQRYPLLERVWFMIHEDLMMSGHLPWALTYPEKALDSQVYGQLMDEMEERKMQAELAKASKSLPGPTPLGLPPGLMPSRESKPEVTTPKIQDEISKLEKEEPKSETPFVDAEVRFMSDKELDGCAETIKKGLMRLSKDKKEKARAAFQDTDAISEDADA